MRKGELQNHTCGLGLLLQKQSKPARPHHHMRVCLGPRSQERGMRGTLAGCEYWEYEGTRGQVELEAEETPPVQSFMFTV